VRAGIDARVCASWGVQVGIIKVGVLCGFLGFHSLSPHHVKVNPIGVAYQYHNIRRVPGERGHGTMQHTTGSLAKCSMI
jgi:hypothetical protein